MTDLPSNRTDLQSSMLDVLWSLSLRPDVMTDVLCCLSLRRRHRYADVLGPLVIVVDEVFFFFRLGF